MDQTLDFDEETQMALRKIHDTVQVTVEMLKNAPPMTARPSPRGTGNRRGGCKP